MKVRLHTHTLFLVVFQNNRYKRKKKDLTDTFCSPYTLFMEDNSSWTWKAVHTRFIVPCGILILLSFISILVSLNQSELPWIKQGIILDFPQAQISSQYKISSYIITVPATLFLLPRYCFSFVIYCFLTSKVCIRYLSG